MQKTILWIEDDIDTIGKVVYLLEGEGFEIIKLRSYAEYLELDRKVLDSLSLILVDLLLPSGGVEIPANTDQELGELIIQDIREDKKLGIPIVVLTALGDFETDHKHVYYLQKAVLPSTLREKVLAILSGK